MIVFESLSSFIENGGMLNEADRAKRPRIPVASRFAEASVSADGSGVYKQGKYQYNDVNNPKNKYALKKNNMAANNTEDANIASGKDESSAETAVKKTPKVIEWETKLGRTLNNREQFAINVTPEELKQCTIGMQVKVMEIREALQRSLKYLKFSKGLEAEFAKFKSNSDGM